MGAIQNTMDGYESNMELTDSAAPAAPSPEAPAVEKPAETDAPKKPVEVAPEEKPAEALYETPDGRKVNAETLQREWKENFLPDYTRKSQKLAEIERGGNKDIKNDPGDAKPKWADPDYVPTSYAEVIQFAKEEAIRELAGAHEAEQNRIKAIQTEVDTQLSAVKASDPKVDENALFLHANKYGFNDLKAAHANMRDMQRVVEETTQRTVKNLKERDADPVSTAASGSSVVDEGYDPRAMSQYGSASEYLARIKGGK